MFSDKMYQHLLDNAASQVELTAADTALCRQYFEPVVFPKNTLVEEESEVPKYLYYVVSGFIRLFHTMKKETR